LYIDEINLLEDHIVDLLLDVAQSGENLVEREGLSIRHNARFVLVGSGNPEEGELRPQLLDRFGLSVEVKTPQDLKQRVEILRRCDAFEQDAPLFAAKWKAAERKTLKRVAKGRELLPSVEMPDAILTRASELCMAVGADGLRGELTLMRAGRALAALEGDVVVTVDHIKRVAPMALRHRLRRNVLDDTGSTARIDRVLAEQFA
jgi:magnesium chelatase subunit I